ncbi:DUF3784 domain-containing protein [Kriegella aquimaris]|uniref:Uncharacterized protein n=1 Tax=Kriegella aquimaris TaxID=192904 RepID=A0A1G9X987_9FLAO|nr:DUF3784 domain-containing protein [Kriegella aquimaris]SDM93330.1 protein of unknown function [Kriegella aquimaris]
MFYVTIGTGLLFIGIGYLITEKNAKYLLSGYNTMSKDEKEKVELKPYLHYFRKFHIFLGLSFMAIGLFLNYISPNIGGIFLGVYPILAYGYFMWTSRGYFEKVKSNKSQLKVGIIIIAASLVFVAAIFYLGYQEDKILLEKDQITLEGFYGEEIDPSQIQSVELVERLPEIKKRTNGFSSGSVHKGYFKQEGGKSVKLILNGEAKPYVLITKKNGERIYYSSRSTPNQKIYDQLKNSFPEVE